MKLVFFYSYTKLVSLSFPTNYENRKYSKKSLINLISLIEMLINLIILIFKLWTMKMHCSTWCCMPWPLAPPVQVRFLRGLFVCPRLPSGDRLPSPAVIYQTLCQTAATDPSGWPRVTQTGMQPLRAIGGCRGGAIVRAAGPWVGAVVSHRYMP